jgi:uroporphyrinogen decarboxylase
MDLGSTRNTGILIEPYRALTEFLHLKDAWLPQEDFGPSRILGVATPEEGILQKLDIDLRGISLGKPDKNLERILPDGLHQDELSVVRHKPADSYYYDLVYSPFDREMTVADLAKWPWPDPTDPGYVRGLREKALAIRTQTDCALVLHLQDIIVHPSQYLLGFERWYTSFLLDPRLLHALMDILLELRTEQGMRALKEVGDLVDVVSSSDDVAGQQGHVISPDLYRQFIKTRHQRYFDGLRHHTSAKILYHSCGSVTALIPDFIDLGIDFINPVQVSAAHMDTAPLKQELATKLAFGERSIQCVYCPLALRRTCEPRSEDAYGILPQAAAIFSPRFTISSQMFLRRTSSQCSRPVANSGLTH